MRLNCFPVLCFLFLHALHGDISSFLEPLSFGEFKTETSHYTRSSALVSAPSQLSTDQAKPEFISEISVNREILEAKLSELLSYRYQAQGVISAFLTREWDSILTSPNFIIKIIDCTPDELTSSTFVRFTLWDKGRHLGSFAEPVRVAHYVDVYFTSKKIERGARLHNSMLISRPVDILRQHAGSVPSSTNILGYQISSSTKANSPIRWNQLSKLTLVQKGKIVDVFASGNGIYVTMKGVALEDGVEGGLVKIKNISSNKTFNAKVLNENSVKVHL